MSLEHMLLLIRQLEAGMIDDLDAVVLVRIVRRGNHHASGERADLRDVSEAGRGDQTGEARADAFALQPAGNVFGDPGAGFARVHTDHDFGGKAMHADPLRQRHADGKSSGAVQRIIAGDAANPVGAK